MNVSGKDWRGHHAVKVDVNILEPEDEVRKKNAAISEVSAGVLSPQDYIREFRPDVDPDTEMGKIWAARMLFSPQFSGLMGQLVTERAASRLGIEEFLQRAIQASEGTATEPSRRTPPNPEGGGETTEASGSRSAQAETRIADNRELGVEL